jgi:hypothetical protein
MLSSLISLNVILCEKVLLEQDQIFSAVRIVDVFYFKRMPSTPLDKVPPIPMSVLVMGKTKPEDSSEHSVQLVLIRPDEETSTVGDPLKAVFQPTMKDDGISRLADGSKVSDIPGGFTIRAEISIVPRQVGRHQFAVYMDDQLVAKVPFTILELKVQTDD